VILCIQVSTQLVQILKVTLPNVMVVGTMGNVLDEVDVTVLWALSAEIL
jgi:hypothetical protein